MSQTPFGGGIGRRQHLEHSRASFDPLLCFPLDLNPRFTELQTQPGTISEALPGAGASCIFQQLPKIPTNARNLKPFWIGTPGGGSGGISWLFSCRDSRDVPKAAVPTPGWLFPSLLPPGQGNFGNKAAAWHGWDGSICLEVTNFGITDFQEIPGASPGAVSSFYGLWLLP